MQLQLDLPKEKKRKKQPWNASKADEIHTVLATVNICSKIIMNYYGNKMNEGSEPKIVWVNVSVQMKINSILN